MHGDQNETLHEHDELHETINTCNNSDQSINSSGSQNFTLKLDLSSEESSDQ